NFTPFKDAYPKAAADARYKALASGKGGLLALKSADGLRWTLMRDAPVITRGAFDSQNLAFWDTEAGKYREYHRGFRGGVRDIMACGLLSLPGKSDELSAYATEAYYAGPAGRLRRFRYRADGFVAAEAGGGELLTRPLRFRGDRLVLNYATRPGGSVTVELL